MCTTRRRFTATFIGLVVSVSLGCSDSGAFTGPVKQPKETFGTIRVKVSTTSTVGGSDSNGYSVDIDGKPAAGLANNDSRLIVLTTGTHVILLKDVDENCSLYSANPVEALVLPNPEIAPISFAVECSESPDSTGWWDY